MSVPHLPGLTRGHQHDACSSQCTQFVVCRSLGACQLYHAYVLAAFELLSFQLLLGNSVSSFCGVSLMQIQIFNQNTVFFIERYVYEHSCDV